MLAGQGPAGGDQLGRRSLENEAPCCSPVCRTSGSSLPAAAATADVGRQPSINGRVAALTGKLPAVAAHLEAARDDILAFTAFPTELWRQIWSNNPNER